jgi:hypothetical protein
MIAPQRLRISLAKVRTSRLCSVKGRDMIDDATQRLGHVPLEGLVVGLRRSDDKHGKSPGILYHAVAASATCKFADTP